ncbi:MAG: GH3 auxin-responsive promoter family protein [Eubacterium sp.]|nr:GH3 auxin-responsive promoter family protein [Eubacterium sp.]
MSKNEYIASVITPFHNTNLNFFRHAFDSVVNQTIGIENVEWLIVVHNSEDEYLQGVKDMTGQYESIKVFELHNDVRSASSPRNYALDKATGKYLFFLDSDDRLTRECIFEVTRRMEENDAVMAKFRSEEESEDDDVVQMVDHRVRYDQTRDLIIMKKGDHAMKDIVTIDNMVPWCQAFRRDFVEENGMRYDISMHTFEDFNFTLTGMGYADKVIVLPQTIGYVYFVNHESTLQQMGSPTPEAIFEMIRNHTKVLKRGIDSGLDVRYIFWSVLDVISHMVMGTPQLTGEQKEKIRASYADLFDQVEPLDADGKIFTRETAEGTMSLVRSVILGEGEGATTEHVTGNVLQDILSKNRTTDIGRRYEFNLIHNKDAYAARVPLSDYDFYEPLIKLTTRVGESAIFCCDSVDGYILSEGGIGVPRRIPFTKGHIRQYSDMIVSVFGDRAGSTFLMISGLPRNNRFEDGTYVESLYGAVLRSVEDSLACNSHAARFRDGWVTSPAELIFPDESVNPRHLWLLFALLDNSVSQIVAPSTWAVLEVFEYLEKYHESIIENLRSGRISMEDPISDDMREKLERRLKPDPDRVDELEEIFKGGFGEPIIRKIWPKLDRVFAFGTGDYSIYTEKLGRYIDSSVEIYNGYLMNPESVIARSLEDDTGRYILLSNHDYFEFIPLKDFSENSRLLREDELEEGLDYELVVTNHAGLYRYRIGDIIHVEKMEDGVPVFTYLRKNYEQCSVKDVTLNVNDLDTVIRRAETEYGISVHDYCLAADEDSGRFTIMIEPSGIDESYQDICGMDRAVLVSGMDGFLCDVSGEYSSARKSGNLAVPEVLILEPETQLLYRDRTMYTRKYMPDQIAPVRILNDPAKEKFFRRFAV